MVSIRQIDMISARNMIAIDSSNMSINMIIIYNMHRNIKNK